MTKYSTDQRKKILSFFSEHPHEVYSAKQLFDLLDDSHISISTIYRNLSELEKSGQISRCNKSGTREAFFKYTHLDVCRECIHLSCKKCGKIFHMDKVDSDELITKTAQNEQFFIEKTDSVLYGVCGSCQHSKKFGG